MALIVVTLSALELVTFAISNIYNCYTSTLWELWEVLRVYT